jgi:GntR family transcriptional regulator
MELFGNKDLINLVLLGLGNDEPLIIYSSFFPYDLGIIMVERAKAKVSNGAPFSSFDLYDGTGVLPKKAYQSFEAVQAVGRTAHILKVPPNSPVFLIKSVFYSFDDIPIEYREAKYKGDRFVFRVKREF